MIADVRGIYTAAVALRIRTAHCLRQLSGTGQRQVSTRSQTKKHQNRRDCCRDQVVTLLEPSALEPVKSKWVKVKTARGIDGFMKAEDVFAAYDEFAVFKKEHQSWYLTSFGFVSLYTVADARLQKFELYERPIAELRRSGTIASTAFKTATQAIGVNSFPSIFTP